METKEFNNLFQKGEIKKFTESKKMYYYVTKNGLIYSISKNDLIIKQLTIHIDVKGYTYTKQNKNRFYVHRAVASAFINNPYDKPEVNHIDGDKSNNHVENLVWSTRKENQQHAWDNGLMENTRAAIKKTIKNRKSNITDNVRNNMSEVSKKHRRKFTEKQVIEIRQSYKNGSTQKEIAERYCVNKATINLIIHGKRYKDIP